MLRSGRNVQRYKVHATDGDIGRIEDFYYDDHRWTIRHVVVDTRHWLRGRRVLIPPLALEKADWAQRRLHVALTKAQVENSPGIDTDKPVARQHDTELYRYYGFPYYLRSEHVLDDPQSWQGQGDPHLRSAREVIGYYVHAVDGEIGHVDDFLVDDESWAIRYLVVSTGSWWPGKRVLVSPGWVAWVSWEGSAVHVDLPRATIRHAPEYDPQRPVDREYETRLYGYYGRPKYWEVQEEKAAPSPR